MVKMHQKKMHHTSVLSLTMLDSAIRVNRKYYPRTLLEECKYEIKKNKIENLINDDLDLSSSDNESDNEYNDESDNESDSEMMLRLTMMKIFNLFHQPYI